MYKSKITLIVFFFINIYAIIAQSSMDDGFAMLNNNEYAKASEFFSNILKEEANNKTAKICFGRAIGLNGQVEDALQVFQTLKVEYPGDQEVNLNLAEAYMWKKDFEHGSDLYLSILNEDPFNFTALQGFANANASLKDYTTAFEYIQKALEVDQSNAGALLSKKYILLGLADQARKNKDYEGALNLLNQILEKNNKDREALLNKAIVFLSDEEAKKAYRIYKQLVEMDIDQFEGYLGMSYTSLLMQNAKNCLSFADAAIEKSKGDSTMQLRAKINKVNSLGFNKDFKLAFDLIFELKAEFGNLKELEIAQARMLTWSQDFEIGLEQYEQMEGETEAEAFLLTMGKAEAYRGIGNLTKAIALIKEALKIVPGQADAQRLLYQLESERNPLFKLEMSSAKDGGGNEAEEIHLKANISLSDEHRLFFGITNRTTRDINLSSANQIRVRIGDEWRIDQKTTVSGSFTSLSFSDAEDNSLDQSLLAFSLARKIGKNSNLKLAYQQDVQAYSTTLIQSNLKLVNLSADYSLQSKQGIGVYIQAMHSSQSDQNKRNSVFASAYYLLNNNPLIKVGVNFNIIQFQNRNALYFSPDQFKSVEAFVQYGNRNDPRNGIKYHAFAAFGQQQIENNERQLTRRFELGLGYQFSKQAQIHLDYLNSNAAQSTVTGFQFAKWSLGLQVRM